MNDFEIYHQLAKQLLEKLNNPCRVRDAFHRHGYGSYRGRFCSAKSPDGWIPYESNLAQDFLRAQELDPRVISIIDEPFTMAYWFEGSIDYYTPDYFVFKSDGTRQVHEIKMQAEASKPENLRKFAAIQLIFELARESFAVNTELTLQSPSLQHNMALLERHKHLTINPVIIGQLHRHLRSSSMTLEELATRIGCRKTVLTALAQGVVATDIYASRIDSNSLIQKVQS